MGELPPLPPPPILRPWVWGMYFFRDWIFLFSELAYPEPNRNLVSELFYARTQNMRRRRRRKKNLVKIAQFLKICS